MANIPPLAFRDPPRPPRRRIVSDLQPTLPSEARNTSILGGKHLDSTIESLPEELVFQILVQLPADFLHEKAKFVCVKWYDIIHSQSFIDTQIRRSTYGLLLLSSRGCHPIYVTAAKGRIETTELRFGCRLPVQAACNGLGMVSGIVTGKCALLLINLATKQPFLLLPLHHPYCAFSAASVEFKLNPDHLSYCGIACSAASMEFKRNPDHLNYCSIACSATSMEYKLALPYQLYAEPRHVEIAVLTLGVDKSWRRVPLPELPENADVVTLLQPSLTTEGFFHWGRGRFCFTLDVETEIVTMSEFPHAPAYQLRYYYLSTGKNLSLLVARGDLFWEVWELKPETGEWRNSMGNIKFKLEAEDGLIELASECGRFLEPLGWVKYPEVLAFRFSGLGYMNSCIICNLDMHETETIKLPDEYKGCRSFAHRNNLLWLS